MSHLDTAAATRACEIAPSRAAHFVGSIGRSMTVLDTSVDLSLGDRTDGPARAQLLLVCEAIGDEGTRRRLNAMAIDTITRELLRDDDWMMALVQDEQHEVLGTLAAAVRTASTSLAAFQPEDTRGENDSVLALTIALVAWPLVAVAHVGDGAVAHLAGGRVTLPMKKPAEEISLPVADGLGGESPPDVEAWSTELGERDALILSTTAVGRGPLSEPDTLGSELARLATAEELVDHLLSRVAESDEAAIAVAKLSEGVAGQMQALTERDVTPPAAEQELVSTLDPPTPGTGPLVEDGAKP